MIVTHFDLFLSLPICQKSHLTILKAGLTSLRLKFQKFAGNYVSDFPLTF